MSSENKNFFTKQNLDTYLKELAKEFRKLNGKDMPAEIILIGGAAILANYGFRGNKSIKYRWDSEKSEKEITINLEELKEELLLLRTNLHDFLDV